MSLNQSPLLYCLLYFQRFAENHNVGACYNELLQLEHGELRSRLKLRALNAMVHALDNIADSVEISNEDHEIQVPHFTLSLSVFCQ